MWTGSRQRCQDSSGRRNQGRHRRRPKAGEPTNTGIPPSCSRNSDGNHNALDHHPDGEHNRERDCGSEDVEQEEAAEENIQQRTEHTRTAVRHESLRAQGEDQLGAAGKEGETAENPCCRNQRNIGFGDTEDTKDYQKNACATQSQILVLVFIQIIALVMVYVPNISILGQYSFHCFVVYMRESKPPFKDNKALPNYTNQAMNR